jgi:3-oxoacyl-[acyl-carrier-protein] synthase-3
MAVAAAARAIESAAGIEAEDVDVVLWTGEEYKDYVAQTASIRLQEEVGAREAWAFDLVGQGVTTLVGLRVARAMMTADPEVETVLLAGASRNCDLVDPSNPDTRWMLGTSAGGAALLLRQRADHNLLLSVALETDAEMADDVYVPGGGTVQPFAPDNLGSAAMFFQVQRPEVVAGYVAEQLPARLVDVARSAMTEAALGDEAPGYLALRHLAPVSAAQVVDGLRARPGGTDGLVDVGHTGPHDVVISLERGLERGVVTDGTVVVLASAGIGFTYAAAAMRWGPA